MGYYATGSGYVKLKPNLDANMILIAARNTFSFDDRVFAKLSADTPAGVIVALDNELQGLIDGYSRLPLLLDLYFDSKYCDDEIKDELNFIAGFSDDLYMEFSGEDDAHWRFVLKDGKLVDEPGFVVYSPEDALRVFSMDAIGR